jgi:FdhE protein
MALVSPPSATRDARLATAEARWAALRDSRPDLAPAVALQTELVTLVIDLTDAMEKGRLPRLSLPPKYLAAKLARGVPALHGEPIPVPTAVIKPTLLRLCQALSAGGAGAAADHIEAEIADGRLEPGSLLSASLARDQNAIRAGGTHRGLSPDLLWLLAELAVGPFVHTLQRMLFSSADVSLVAALTAWDRGYCPACGSWPALAEVVGGHRALRCSFCAAGWELGRYACVYCGHDGEQFVTAAPNEERLDRRLELCAVCAGYLKTVDLPDFSPFPLLSISDLETMDLDAAAMDRGFRRPPMKEFK